MRDESEVDLIEAIRQESAETPDLTRVGGLLARLAASLGEADGSVARLAELTALAPSYVRVALLLHESGPVRRTAPVARRPRRRPSPKPDPELFGPSGEPGSEAERTMAALQILASLVRTDRPADHRRLDGLLGHLTAFNGTLLDRLARVRPDAVGPYLRGLKEITDRDARSALGLASAHGPAVRAAVTDVLAERGFAPRRLQR